MRLRKVYDIASFKALPDANGQKGRFEAIVSVFGNVDLQGDRVVPGAFKATLKAWGASGDPIPVIWSHDWADPFAHIGWADPKDCEEVMPGAKAGAASNGGLLIRGQFDIDKPFAAQVYDLLKTRRVREWSFAYDTQKEREAADGANELVVLDLIEAGPTLKGANPDTITLGVKSDLEKASSREPSSRILAAAMEIDPAIARVLTNGHIAPKAPAKSAEAYRVMKQLPQFKDKYDLERPDVYVCIDAKGSIESEHATEELAVEHIDELERAESIVALEPEGVKNFYGAPDGSDEERLMSIQRAVDAWADAEFAADAEGDHAYACVVGTFADYVVVSVEMADEAPEFFEFAYIMDDAGDVQLGDMTTVSVEVEVTPKSTEPTAIGTVYVDIVPRTKAGRVIGVKRVSDLKAAVGESIDTWATTVNGELEDPEGDGAKAVEQPEILEPAGEKAADTQEVLEDDAAPVAALEDTEALVLEPGDKADYARGYADAAAKRNKNESPTEEYTRGYELGESERRAVEDAEIRRYNEQFDKIVGGK